MAANVEFERPLSVEQARQVLSDQEGCVVVDYRQDEGYVTPKEAAGEDMVYVSASARISRQRMRWRSGAWRTTCARARHSMPSRSQKS